jgi:hypothetical protein
MFVSRRRYILELLHLSKPIVGAVCRQWDARQLSNAPDRRERDALYSATETIDATGAAAPIPQDRGGDPHRRRRAGTAPYAGVAGDSDHAW